MNFRMRFFMHEFRFLEKRFQMRFFSGVDGFVVAFASVNQHSV